MQIADTELSALDVDGEVDLAASAQILNVTISSMLGASGDCACAFFSHFSLDILWSAPGMCILRFWGLGDGALQ